ncbi:MAG TPA: DUF1552 domain-containing protein [Polyangia bacterium]|nr:DUF1552 domain-containing protein [Polyangia bacterium]
MNRRRFLGTIGSGATALALSSSIERLAHAVAGPPVKRFITFYVSSGAAASYFWPDTVGTSFELKKSIAPLAPYQSKMTMIQGLTIGPGSNHRFGMDNCLTVGAQDSFEQVLAANLKANLLNLSVAPLAGGNEMSFIKGVRQPGIYDPAQARAEVLRTVDPTALGSQGKNIAAIRQFKSLAMTLSQKELDALGKQVASLPYESAKVRSHVEAVQQVKASLDANPTQSSASSMSCSMLSTTALDKTKGLVTNGDAVQPNLPALLDAQIENTVEAFMCGQRTMANLQVMHAWGNHVFSWLGFSGAHHQQLSHWVPSQPTGQTAMDFATCHNWMSTRFLTLLQGLDVPDPLSPGKTILDNTCILWTSEVDGGDAHTVQSIPTILFGSLGGTLKTGQFLKYGDIGGVAPNQNPTMNRNMGDLFATLSNAMGAPTTTGYGPRMGQGIIKEILA